MSVSGNKHSFLRQSGNLTFKGWIIIFFEGKLLEGKTAEPNHEREATGNDSSKCFLLSLFDAQAIAHQARSCSTLRWEKIHVPENWPTPTLTSKK